MAAQTARTQTPPDTGRKHILKVVMDDDHLALKRATADIAIIRPGVGTKPLGERRNTDRDVVICPGDIVACAKNLGQTAPSLFEHVGMIEDDLDLDALAGYEDVRSLAMTFDIPKHEQRLLDVALALIGDEMSEGAIASASDDVLKAALRDALVGQGLARLPVKTRRRRKPTGGKGGAQASLAT